MRTIVLNSSNILPDGQNNKLVYGFPGSVVFKDTYVALSQINMYYSWYNISTSLLNNVLQYTWVVGATTSTITITIPNGLYEVSTLNELLQFTMISNGHYLINSTGQNVYYAEMLLNPSRYAVQINTFLFPISLPAGFTTPGNFPGFPTQSFNPQIITPFAINQILGFPVGFTTDANTNNSYVPPSGQDLIVKLANGTLSYISTTAPNVQPNSSILVSVSNIDNQYATPSSILYSIVPTVGFGELISEKPPQYAFNKLIDGTYNTIRMTFLGTDLQPIKINDPNMTIILVFKDKNEVV
jgi:hypothetical protein